MLRKLKALCAIAVPPLIIITLAIAINVNKKTEYPDPNTYDISDSLETSTTDRTRALERFFEKYNSPLIAYSETFVNVADKYNLDYSLLPAISCLESTCGKHMIPQSYNPFGWGIYGNNYIAFSSFDEAIETVGKGLKDNYINKGYETLEEIAPIYNPPNPIKWMSGINHFKNEIGKAQLAYTYETKSRLE